MGFLVVNEVAGERSDPHVQTDFGVYQVDQDFMDENNCLMLELSEPSEPSESSEPSDENTSEPSDENTIEPSDDNDNQDENNDDQDENKDDDDSVKDIGTLRLRW